MIVRNLKRFLRDLNGHGDPQHAEDVPVPKSGIIGIVIPKPYRQHDLDRLNDLLDQVNRDEVELDLHHVARAVFVGAHTPLRRPTRRVS